MTFYLGKKDSKGRYMRAPKRTVHGSKADARAAVSAYIAEYEAAHDPTNQLITTYALNFHALRKDDPSVKKLTYEREGREIADVGDVSVNIFFTISTNIFSPIAPPLFRRPRQRGCAASG